MNQFTEISTTTAADRDTIEAFLARIRCAWDRGDARAFAREFADDATYVSDVPYDKLQTFALVRRDGRWACAAFQNTSVGRRARRAYNPGRAARVLGAGGP